MRGLGQEVDSTLEGGGERVTCLYRAGNSLEELGRRLYVTPSQCAEAGDTGVLRGRQRDPAN